VEIEHKREFEKKKRKTWLGEEVWSVDKRGCGREAIGGGNYGLYFLRY
jgi:hypothetical protein